MKPDQRAHLCAEPGCSAVIVGAGRCAEHVKRGTPRKPAPARGYDAAWSRARRRYLATHRTCERPGCTQAAEHVHHLDRNPTGPDAHRPKNLRALCAEHHRAEHATPRRSGWVARPLA